MRELFSFADSCLLGNLSPELDGPQRPLGWSKYILHGDWADLAGRPVRLPLAGLHAGGGTRVERGAERV